MWNGVAVTLLAVVQAAAPAAQPPERGGEVVVELIAEDARGRTVKDLQAHEVVLQQDDVRQTIRSLRYLTERGVYELRYEPTSGRVGAVAIGLSRPAVRLRGPEGPQVKPRWIAPVRPFEVPLKAALDAAQPADGLAFDWSALRFETRDDTLHHAFVAEIPLSAVSVQPGPGGAQSHLTFLLRVKAADGRLVHEGSLDQPLDIAPVSIASVAVRRFVWSSHVHLRPGRYVAELAVKDVFSGTVGVRRMPLDVAVSEGGLRISSLTFLLGAEGVMAGPEEDNPLRLPQAELVPMLRPSWIAGSGGALSLLALLYPDRGSKETVTAVIELHRDGQLRSKAPLPLPPPDGDGRIRFLGGLGFTALQPGQYVLKLVARQGIALAEETAVLEVLGPSRVTP